MRRETRLKRNKRLWTVEVTPALDKALENYLNDVSCIFNTKSETIRRAVQLLIASDSWTKRARFT